ncbi:MAG TPA: DUF4440 domain-containing protein [Urbifossiella sp.]|jgi:uncharacterized protein (TIGR02246 family)|nr:DUF4440 domain-containing protein [Urbifossiella sp.]
MRRSRLVLAVALAAVAAGTTHHQLPARAAAQPGDPADEAAAGVRKNAAEYTKAFNAGDAKGAALSWSLHGEYTDPDGETFRGRAAVEAELAAVLKANPKAAVEITIDSVRRIGRQAAYATGSARTRTPADPEPAVTRFGGLFVEEDGGWKIASLHDWVPDPATDVTVADLGWLAGAWTTKGPGGDLRVEYAWNETKTFLNGTYALNKDGKAVSAGTQVFGTNPAGGLRAWAFDGSGATGEAVWTRDGNRWLVEATDTLPDGTEVSAVNVLVPLGPDAFTWQSTRRTAGGVGLPDQPPLRITRVKTK